MLANNIFGAYVGCAQPTLPKWSRGVKWPRRSSQPVPDMLPIETTAAQAEARAVESRADAARASPEVGAR